MHYGASVREVADGTKNADSAGLNRFPIRPATFARSAAHAQYRVQAVYIYIVTARPLSPQEGPRSRSPQLYPRTGPGMLMGLVPQVAVVSGLRNSIMNIDTQANLANYLRADVIAMECLCMTCGKTLGKDRRPFSGRPYSALFEMVRDHKAATGQALSAAEIHCVLASTPSYVCKLCVQAM